MEKRTWQTQESLEGSNNRRPSNLRPVNEPSTRQRRVEKRSWQTKESLVGSNNRRPSNMWAVNDPGTRQRRVEKRLWQTQESLEGSNKRPLNFWAVNETGRRQRRVEKRISLNQKRSFIASFQAFLGLPYPLLHSSLSFARFIDSQLVRRSSVIASFQAFPWSAMSSSPLFFVFCQVH